jgi:hypothetical protein
VRLALVFGACAALAVGCSRNVAGSRADLPAYQYVLGLPAAGSWALSVEATLERAPSEALIAPESNGAVRDVVLAESNGPRALARRAGIWIAPECRTRCTLRYAVDLDKLPSGCRGMGCARRVDDAVVASAAAWILRPEPSGDASLWVRLGDGDPSRFATGLRRGDEGSYRLHASELGEASYTAFGALRRQRIEMGDAALDVVFLGAPLTMGDRATVEWVRNGASCVSGLFKRFPVDATVFVIPVRGAEEVVFGRVMSLAGASVALLFGSDACPEDAREDWVVVHELFHLGTPSFVGEGHWLEEGLATYYEPILRERAGWMTEADLWKHFVEEMPRGLRKEGSPLNLEERDDIDSTYWGGALYALLADVRIRQQTRGARSLDDALRAALAREGDATHTARVNEFLRTGDEATGTHVLSGLHVGFVQQGEIVDLGALWRSMGLQIAKTGAVTLHDDAPLASIRRAISFGDRH